MVLLVLLVLLLISVLMYLKLESTTGKRSTVLSVPGTSTSTSYYKCTSRVLVQIFVFLPAISCRFGIIVIVDCCDLETNIRYKKRTIIVGTSSRLRLAISKKAN